ncbi:MAG: transglycosylase SLT domain-containing protein, partial [Candidatus Saganbacteria bacterium]|nr:transglycosylase SLT domain-containing protein [Candidatus Saganbacteria bacterium]
LSDYAKFAIAETEAKKGAFDKAMIRYKELAGKSPGESILSEKSAIRIGQILMDEGKNKEANSVLRKFVDSYPNSIYLAEARYNLGQSYEKLGTWKDASMVYQQISVYHPLNKYANDAGARLKNLRKKYKLPYYKAPAGDLFAKAMIFFNKGDYGSASQGFIDLIRLYPNDKLTDDAYVVLGRSETRRKRYPYATVYFKKAIKFKGDQADAAQFYMAFAWGRSGNLNRALSSLRSVISSYPNSDYVDDARYYLGYYCEINKNEEKALDAYKDLVKNSKKSPFAIEALWKIGRIYYKEKKWEDAYAAFQKGVLEYEAGEYTDECAFWMGMSAEKLGKNTDAENAYKFLIEDFDHTYYSYRARDKLKDLGIESKPEKIKNSGFFAYLEENLDGGEELSSPTFDEDELEEGEAPVDIIESIKPKEEKTPEIKKEEKFFSLHVDKFKELMSLCLFQEALNEASFIKSIAPESKSDTASIIYGEANFACGNFTDSLVLADGKLKEAISSGKAKDLLSSFWKLAYPRAFYNHVLKYSRDYNVDPFLVLAVMREESRFNPKVVSWARARGLMQIIPSTGRVVARSVGISPYYTGRLFEPEVNIEMGCYYLSNLIKRFDGNAYLALAAYNGGPNRVARWLNSRRSETIDIDEFVEAIPLYETRQYVGRVMGSYMEYKRIYGKEG